MPAKTLDFLKRTMIRGREEHLVLRPGLAIQLYTTADLAKAKAEAADVLEAYLEFIPFDAIQAKFDEGFDEYSAGFIPFDAVARGELFHELRHGVIGPDDEGWDFVLSATPDGQAGQYGVRFRGTTFSEPEERPDETTLLRLELPWNLLDHIDVERFVGFIEEIAALFSFCTGHAGHSFINTVAYEAQARPEIAKLVPRFLGFDCAFDWMYGYMRGKVPPTHWIHLLDADTVGRLGGREALATALAGCELRDLPQGALLVRGANFPPVADVNRLAPDIGLLPTVNAVLAPLRYDQPGDLGLGDDTAGQNYLERFDSRLPMPWDNG
jgi:hypothetical protein